MSLWYGWFYVMDETRLILDDSWTNLPHRPTFCVGAQFTNGDIYIVRKGQKAVIPSEPEFLIFINFLE